MCSAHQAHILGTKTVFRDFEPKSVKNTFCQSFWTKIYKIRGNFARRKIRKIILHFLVYSDLHPYGTFPKKVENIENSCIPKMCLWVPKTFLRKNYEKYIFVIFLYILLPFFWQHFSGNKGGVCKLLNLHLETEISSGNSFEWRAFIFVKPK